MRFVDSPSSWTISYDLPELPNFLFWLRWRTADAPPCPEAAWWEWLDEIMAFGLPGRWTPDQHTLIRYPALAELAEREWPVFRREWHGWHGDDGHKMALAWRIIRGPQEVPPPQPPLEEILEGSSLELRFMLVVDAGDLVRQVGPNTWLLGEAYLDPPRQSELVARLRRDLED